MENNKYNKQQINKCYIKNHKHYMKKELKFMNNINKVKKSVRVTFTRN